MPVRLLRALLFVVAPVTASATTTSAPAAPSIAYTIASPDPASHFYEIDIAIGGWQGRTIALQLPVWSPGRYGRMDFARNVQEFRATDAAGKPIAWDKTDGSRWVLAMNGAHAVHVHYRVF